MKELAPFLLQGSILLIDEIICHRHREMRTWERIGHPLDSLFFIICLAFLYVSPVTAFNLYIFSALAILSCVFVTKDELEHFELCGPFENWLHSLLYLLHPVLLIWAGYLWWSGHENFNFVISLAIVLSLLFTLYQTVYWNWWKA